ncbi:MAG: LysR family transcriptional regulator [Myxococcota bacterium]
MDADDVVVFLAVARAGSFTEAARRLGTHQSTVSRRIAELEASLGGRLFQRSARAFQLTPLASRLLPEAEAVAAAVERFRQSAAHPDRPAGVVRLATAEELASELLVPALGALWEAAPEIDLVLEGRTELVPIGPGGADVALRVVRPAQQSLRFRKVGALRYGVYASAAYLAVPTAERRWLALHDPEGVLQETRWVAARSAGRTPRFRANDTRDLARAAADGLGLAILPEALARRHDLVCLEETGLTRTLWLVTHEALAEEARVRAVIDWVVATSQRAMAAL